MRETIILTVSQKSGGKFCAFRLRANKRDNGGVSQFEDKQRITMIAEGVSIPLESRNTEKCRNELDSRRGLLNKWIKVNEFDNYFHGKRARLRFELESIAGKAHLIFQGRA